LSIICGCLGDCEGKFSRGGNGAVENIDECGSGILTGDTGPDYSYDVGEGEDCFEDEGSNRVDYDDGVLVDGGDGGDESISGVPGVEVLAISYGTFDLLSVLECPFMWKMHYDGGKTYSDVSFTGISIDENNSCGSGTGDRCSRGSSVGGG